jgi:Na+/H+ antiporter NhaD/arsenite permease-like protein
MNEEREERRRGRKRRRGREGWGDWFGDEKEQEEGFGEKWRRDPVDAAGWAAILIWAGLVFLAGNLGFLARFERLETWGLIFLGAGLIVLLTVVARQLVPSYRRPVTGSLVFAVILLAVGLGGLVGWDVIWPVVLIVIGLAIIVGGLMRTRRP